MIEIIPAYGRTYKNTKGALIDWETGKDFQIFNGPYCSVRDLNLLVKEYDRVVLVINNDRYELGSNIWGSI